MIVRSVILTLVLVASISAQNIAFTGVVGTGQAVPPPSGTGVSGLADMSGAWFNAVGQQLLNMQLHYIPSAWASGAGVTESCIFLYETGAAALPGVPRLGGLIYVPVPYNPGIVIARLGGVTWNGPGDTVVPTSQINSGVPCPPGMGPCNYGKNFSQFLALTPAMIGTQFTCQAFMLDSAINRLYSSNAVNMQVVP